jgi:hypothetical protein
MVGSRLTLMNFAKFLDFIKAFNGLAQAGRGVKVERRFTSRRYILLQCKKIDKTLGQTYHPILQVPDYFDTRRVE